MKSLEMDIHPCKLEDAESMKKPSSIVAIFYEFMSRYPRHFLQLFLLLIVEGGTAGMTVLALVPFADFMLDPSMENCSRVTRVVLDAFASFGLLPSFWLLGLFFIAFNLLKGLLDVIIRYSILRIKYDVVRGLVGEALQTFFRARWEFFSGSKQGRLLNTLNKELNNIGDTLGNLATLLAHMVQLVIYLAIPLWMNLSFTLLSLSLIVLLGLPFLLLHRASYNLGQKNTETANVLMGVLSEVLGAARLHLGFGRQNQACKRYLQAFDRHVYYTLRSQTLGDAVFSIFRPLALMAVVASLGFTFGQQTQMSEIAAVMWSLLASLPILAKLLQGNISINNFLPSYEQLVSLRERAAELEECEGTQIFSQLHSCIEMKGVDFNYPGRMQTLTDVNILIPRGQMTALVGESGSGKSTVTDLVLGLQIPRRGQVLIDGTPLEEFRKNSFRERIGYVPQDPLLFDASVRDNLLWAYGQANEEDLWAALSLAHAEEFVKELPQDIDTLVGDRGVRLSGGQRQRIALARALLRKPELLILDEATSSLDTESEQFIQHSIEQVAKETTILIVAHRLSTIAKADQVYVLRQGKVFETGSFGALRNRPESVLNAMIAAQSGNT